MADRELWRKNLPKDFDGRHADEWDVERLDGLLTSEAIAAGLVDGRGLDELLSIADRARDEFLVRRRPYLTYPQ